MQREGFDLNRGEGINQIKISSDYNDKLLKKLNGINCVDTEVIKENKLPRIQDFIFKDKIAGVSFLLAGVSLIFINSYGLNMNLNKYLFQATELLNQIVHFRI